MEEIKAALNMGFELISPNYKIVPTKFDDGITAYDIMYLESGRTYAYFHDNDEEDCTKYLNVILEDLKKR